MKLYCVEKGCQAEHDKPYVIDFSPETYMDEHNVADMFCPHCGKTLEKNEGEKQ
jgi:hypothetical protein